MAVTWLRRLTARNGHPRIGPVGFTDAEQLAEIHAGAFARPWGTVEFESFLLDAAIRIDGLFLGRSRQPCGFAVSRTVLDEAEILSVALARFARGFGHSRPLLAQHLNGLAHAGIDRVHLEVEEGNDAALALYRRLGFQPSGIRHGYYARPDGTRAAALSMTLVLSSSSPARPP